MPELLSFYTEKHTGLGEDAKPISEKLNADVYLIGVFDGLGGAGGRRFILPNKQSPVKGSWLASRIIRKSVLQYFKDNHKDSFKFFANIVSAKNNLQDKLLLSLKEFLGKLELNNPPSKLKGQLAIRALPTTMAACYITNSKLAFLWAGDSRGYILDRGGLHQYTKDDLDIECDALDNLSKTSEISNKISELGFELRHSLLSFTSPSIILTATDGCFDNYITPMHFEYVILSTMQESSFFEEWKTKLSAVIAKESTDDSATMSLFCSGWNNFSIMKKDFSSRLAIITEKYINLINSADKESRDTIIKSLWEKYKKDYDKTECNMPNVLGNTSEYVAVHNTVNTERVPTESHETVESKISSADTSKRNISIGDKLKNLIGLGRNSNIDNISNPITNSINLPVKPIPNDITKEDIEEYGEFTNGNTQASANLQNAEEKSVNFNSITPQEAVSRYIQSQSNKSSSHKDFSNGKGESI